MRGWLFVGTLVAGLTATSVHGAPPVDTAGPTVSVAEARLPADLADSDAHRLQTSLVSGLERAGISIASDGPPTTLEVRRVGSDYEVVVAVRSPDDERSIAQASETCELCGMAELEDTVLAVAGRLRQRLDLATEEAMLVVDTTPSGATVYIDDQEVGTTPLRTGVSQGPHSIRVSTTGYASEVEDFEARAGAESQFSFSLERQRYRRWVPWVALGSGVALLGTAAGLLAIHNDPIERDCNPDIEGNCEFLHDTLPGGASLAVVGGALVVTGVVLAVTWRERGTQEEQPRVSASPGGLRVRF